MPLSPNVRVSSHARNRLPCTALVGAYRKAGETSGFDASAAYVFERDYGGVDAWGQVAKLTGSDTSGSDSFGHSVGIEGDTALVGAPNEDERGDNAAAVYIFA